jgi:hypothetical protein
VITRNDRYVRLGTGSNPFTVVSVPMVIVDLFWTRARGCWMILIMARFGIQGYEPQWLRARDEITAAHSRRLVRLTGRTLRHVWLVWDLEADRWFADAPVLLDFDGERVGVDHQRFDDLCITWNAIDPARAIESSSADLAWRPEPMPQLAGLPGRPLRGVELFDWAGADVGMAAGGVAIGLSLAGAWLTIFNAEDENGLSLARPSGDALDEVDDRQRGRQGAE